jgi:hypothetical protein
MGVSSCTHLPRKGQRWLVQALLLRIADIRVYNPLERQLVPRLEFVAKIFGLDGELATNGILHIENGGVEVADGEGLHGVRETDVVDWARVVK